MMHVLAEDNFYWKKQRGIKSSLFNSADASIMQLTMLHRIACSPLPDRNANCQNGVQEEDGLHNGLYMQLNSGPC